MSHSGKRAIIIVFDSLGIGELPDASIYNDCGSNTLSNIIEKAGPLKLENLEALGLGHVHGVRGMNRVGSPIGSFGRMIEVSPGKDTTTGHLELSGIILKEPFRTYPEGFPLDILDEFTRVTGYGWLYGKAASGTEIIERFGFEHIRTGKPIVYTSADSVFQIAAHEDVIPVDELYRICSLSREMLNRYNIGRVIARPFTGKEGGFKRTPRRKDFALMPEGETLLGAVNGAGMEVVGIGKVPDIFCHKGFTREVKASINAEVMEKVGDELGRESSGLVFANLVDFDMLYGHRNDVYGYAKAIEEADAMLGSVIEKSRIGDMIIVTADHGCDPTTPSTDHSREYVPVLVYGKALKGGVALGTRKSFADVSATVREFLGVKHGIKHGSKQGSCGESFLPLILD